MDELPAAIVKRADGPTTKRAKMSPELELLDQLLGGPMSLAVLRRLFSSQSQFQRAVEAMINDDSIRLVDADGVAIPKWQWESNKAEGNNWKLELTKKGIDRIEGKVRI